MFNCDIPRWYALRTNFYAAYKGRWTGGLSGVRELGRFVVQGAQMVLHGRTVRWVFYVGREGVGGRGMGGFTTDWWRGEALMAYDRTWRGYLVCWWIAIQRTVSCFVLGFRANYG